MTSTPADRPDPAAELIARAADKIKAQVADSLDLIFRRDDALEIVKLYLDGDLSFGITRAGIAFVGEAAAELAPPDDPGTGLYL